MMRDLPLPTLLRCITRQTLSQGSVITDVELIGKLIRGSVPEFVPGHVVLWVGESPSDSMHGTPRRRSRPLLVAVLLCWGGPRPSSRPYRRGRTRVRDLPHAPRRT